jgi:hypothetical protein
MLKAATMRLEEQIEDDMTVASHSTTGFPRQQTPHEMYYSVVWSTEDRGRDNLDSLDLSENKERWLAKLGSWSDALEVYEEKLLRNPNDFDATLGCMRCLSSSGEWKRVLELADDSWLTISAGFTDDVALSKATVATSREKKKALRMCAESSWRLGRWDDLEKYSSELVHGQGNPIVGITTPSSSQLRDGSFPRIDFEGAFYSAVLHIHRAEWRMAAEAIDAARQAMDGRLVERIRAWSPHKLSLSSRRSSSILKLRGVHNLEPFGMLLAGRICPSPASCFCRCGGIAWLVAVSMLKFIRR